MTHFAYLRVSTDQQDNQNQKLSILDYCNTHHLAPLTFLEDTVSGTVPWRNRKIGEILDQAQPGQLHQA